MKEQMMITVVIVTVLALAIAFFLYKKEKYTKLPLGNYENTCEDIHMSGNILYATCKDDSGKYTKTSYNTSTKPCNYIQNINGTLECKIPYHTDLRRGLTGFWASSYPNVGIFVTDDIFDLFDGLASFAFASDITRAIDSPCTFEFGRVGHVLPHNWNPTGGSDNISMHVYIPDTKKFFIINDTIKRDILTLPNQLGNLSQKIKKQMSCNSN